MEDLRARSRRFEYDIVNVNVAADHLAFRSFVSTRVRCDRSTGMVVTYTRNKPRTWRAQ